MWTGALIFVDSAVAASTCLTLLVMFVEFRASLFDAAMITVDLSAANDEPVHARRRMADDKNDEVARAA